MLMGLAALAMVLELGPAAVLTFATLASALATPFEPARAALLPVLVDTPEQLTATIVAPGPTQLMALERHEFLGSVTGYDKSSRAADSLASARLARSRSPLAS